jgi:hypothetical protein
MIFLDKFSSGLADRNAENSRLENFGISKGKLS